MTAVTASAAALAAHVRLIRAAADLLEQAGLTGLGVWPEPDEIVIQVPEHAGDVPSRTAAVARLAALAGGQSAPDYRPGPTCGWIQARGMFAGYPVRIYTPVTKEQAS
jgi:hypothetical protein